ncbi:DarT ssDNA thymidine ADP-ribosyltransferase family protein, partial [bacterium]|nr:DarT ssDNA thymidine ADP-ribosyltransferase family protein [bacterium]
TKSRARRSARGDEDPGSKSKASLLLMYKLAERYPEVERRFIDLERKRLLEEIAWMDRKISEIDVELERRSKEREEARVLRRRQEKREQAARARQREFEREFLGSLHDVAGDPAMSPKAYLQERGVDYLLHFTRTSQLPRIAREGLRPRAELETSWKRPPFNDPLRLDHRRDSVCCSIGFPNYAMFYTVREREGDRTWWCVLGIEVSILDHLPALFCIENAAAAGAVEDAIQRSIAGDPIRALFGNVKCKQGLVRRSSLGLESIHPTHPQAEVLLEGTIPPQFIRGVLFPDEAGRNWCCRKLTKMEHPWEYHVHPAAFGRRADWQFWSQTSNG